MLKKLIIAAAAVVVGLVIIRTTKIGKEFRSLTELWWNQSGDWAKNQVPPETRIEQLEMEIGKIKQDVLTAVEQRAGLKADYVMLEDDVKALKNLQAQRKTDLLNLADLVEQGTNEVVFKGHTFGSKIARQKLDGLTNTYEMSKQTLKAKSELLAAKGQRLELAEQHINKIQQKQVELANMVDQMKTQLANIRMKQLENNSVDIDESQVSKCVKLQQELRRMLLKEEVLAEEKARFGLTTPVAAPARDEGSAADSVKAARTAVGGDIKPVVRGKLDDDK